MKRIKNTRIILPNPVIEIREARIVSEPDDQWCVWMSRNRRTPPETAVMMVDENLLMGEDRRSILTIIQKVKRSMVVDHKLEFSWAPVTPTRLARAIESDKWLRCLNIWDQARQLADV